MLNNNPPIKFPKDTAPHLIVVIDTEEEFDWFASPKRESNTVSAMKQIHLVQSIFEQYGIKPCYVVDYPVVSQEEGYQPLQKIYEQGKCEIGAHLHPWVNPPFEEPLSRSNMYPGNLSYDLEFSKKKILRDEIHNKFGFYPNIYKAGRYGIGINTSTIMQKLGFDIDLSVCTAFDYSEDGGPDFTLNHPEPFWIDKQQELLSIPLSGSFVGIAGNLSKYFYNLAGQLNFLKARAILARLGIVDRLMLSPEGYTTNEHIKLTQFLFNQGVRTFTWNFHSPTVVPGMTPYTHSKDDLTQFLDSFHLFFDFFFNKLNGIATTPSQLKLKMEAF